MITIPIYWKGGHIDFGADPAGVGVGVTLYSNSREDWKNVFAVNLGHRDNVHEFWRKTLSECSRESDQIAE